MGADGWLGIGWPVEHGGQGRGPIEQLIFFDEASRAEASSSSRTSGGTLMILAHARIC